MAEIKLAEFVDGVRRRSSNSAVDPQSFETAPRSRTFTKRSRELLYFALRIFALASFIELLNLRRPTIYGLIAFGLILSALVYVGIVALFNSGTRPTQVVQQIIGLSVAIVSAFFFILQGIISHDSFEEYIGFTFSIIMIIAVRRLWRS